MYGSEVQIIRPILGFDVLISFASALKSLPHCLQIYLTYRFQPISPSLNRNSIFGSLARNENGTKST
jgi:hypothetical protein